MDFEELYNAYAEDVYRYVLSLCRNTHIAEDVTGETFLKAIKTIDRFKGDCEMRVWLCQIAKNTYYTLANKSKFITENTADFQCIDNFEHQLIEKAQALEVHKLLHRLREPYKEVFSLRVFSELSFADIGAIFGRPETWARVTFHRAKNMLKEGISND